MCASPPKKRQIPLDIFPSAAYNNEKNQGRIIMFCTNCGKEINENAYVCPGCGALVQPKSTSAPENGAKKTNVLAIVGFVLSFIFPIAGLICSIIGHRNAAQYQDQYKSLALAGIIISAVALALSLLAVVLGLLWVYGILGIIASVSGV